MTMNMAAQTKIIAHRGYWNKEGSAQHSISSLKNAAEAGVYGSEFDVLMTKDGVLVVNHDDKINGKDIQKKNYPEIKNEKLKNGETMPTLLEYLTEGKKHEQLKMILEMKPLYSKQAEDEAVVKCVAMIDSMGMKDQVDFISFSMNICEQLLKQSPGSLIAYLEGDVAPEKLKSMGFSGLDYNYKKMLRKKEWIKEAQDNGVLINVWTVNDKSKMKELVDLNVDYITTDYPLEAKEIAAK